MIIIIVIIIKVNIKKYNFYNYNINFNCVSFKYLSEAMFVPTLYSSSNWSLKDRKEQSN